MIRKIKQDDEVYVVMTPNNAIKQYRSIKCKVRSIYYRGSSQRSEVEYDDENPPKDFRLTLTNVETQAFYTKKYLEKIYFEDELDRMQEDINNLNKILEFKQKQKQELKDYIKQEFPNWKYKGELNI